MGEIDADGVSFDFHGIKSWTGEFDFLAVGVGQGDAREAVADILFILWVDVVLFADVDGDGEAGVGKREDGGLGFADDGVVTGGILGGKLAGVELEIPLAP